MSHLLEPIPMQRDAKPIVTLEIISEPGHLEGFAIGDGKKKGEMIYNDLFIHSTQMFHMKLVGKALSNVVIDEYEKKTLSIELDVTSRDLLKTLEGRLPQSQKYTFYSVVRDDGSLRLKLPERHGKQYYLSTGLVGKDIVSVELVGARVEMIVAVGLYTSPRNYGLYLSLQSINF
jgi:hypothetical protein